MSIEPFGFVGLGAMGGPMIEKAIEAGLTVYAFDTNQAALDSAAKSRCEGREERRSGRKRS